MLALIAVAEPFEERFELRHVVGRDFETGQHAPEIRAVVAVVEQADVPAAAQFVQERHERAGTLGELESAELLVGDIGAAAADHVAHVQLRHLVVGQFDRVIPTARQRGREVRGILA